MSNLFDKMRAGHKEKTEAEGDFMQLHDMMSGLIMDTTVSNDPCDCDHGREMFRGPTVFTSKCVRCRKLPRQEQIDAVTGPGKEDND